VSAGIRNIGTVNLTKSMANVLGPFGINVYAVYPGFTLTEARAADFKKESARVGKTVEELMKQAAEITAIKRLVSAEDIANLVAFLCSPLAAGITGEAIAINGGASADVHY
jgi:NAD(P)-dependent dehydrogenase (short-subunit alcohol dehydrogenase family)